MYNPELPVVAFVYPNSQRSDWAGGFSCFKDRSEAAAWAVRVGIPGPEYCSSVISSEESLRALRAMAVDKGHSALLSLIKSYLSIARQYRENRDHPDRLENNKEACDAFLAGLRACSHLAGYMSNEVQMFAGDAVMRKKMDSAVTLLKECIKIAEGWPAAKTTSDQSG